MTVDLRADDGAARVRAVYAVEGGAPGAELPAELLDFPPAFVDSIRVGAGAAPAVAIPDVGLARRLALPMEVHGPPEVRLAWRVSEAVEERGGGRVGRIPLVVVDRPPSDASPGLFRVRLLVPPEWELNEGFPTGMRDLGGGAWEAELPVVPAVVRFRARADGAWRPGLPWFLDGVALLGLVTFSVLGWRHLREEAG